MYFLETPPYFGSYNTGKLRILRHRGRIGEVQSSQSRWTVQYKKCVQYSTISSLLQSTALYSEVNWKSYCTVHPFCTVLPN